MFLSLLPLHSHHTAGPRENKSRIYRRFWLPNIVDEGNTDALDHVAISAGLS
ncbi:MAG: hypothetical protein PF501_14995 [Salinisphaera sp.]|jgi:hypothetical protein|nr:hypothetical protein [Salinisphaera sp.]